MTLYTITGTSTTTVVVDSGIGQLIDGTTVQNPITGAAGVVDLKIQNTSNSAIATVSISDPNQVYEYANVAPTGGTGTGAFFTVFVTQGGYTGYPTEGGTGYTQFDLLTIDGGLVGGSTPANDVFVTVYDVEPSSGSITLAGVGGSAVWPQSAQPTVTVLPNSSEFVHVYSQSTEPQNIYVRPTLTDGTVVVTPVTVEK